MWRTLRKTNPSSRRRGDPTSKHINGLGTNKNLVMCPGCAGEDHQQFTGPDWYESVTIFIWSIDRMRSLHKYQSDPVYVTPWELWEAPSISFYPEGQSSGRITTFTLLGRLCVPELLPRLVLMGFQKWVPKYRRKEDRSLRRPLAPRKDCAL
jgi:hypothetical protein